MDTEAGVIATGGGGSAMTEEGGGGGIRCALGRTLREARGDVMAGMGPWEVKEYPAKGKIKACKYFSSKQRGVQLCFDQVGEGDGGGRGGEGGGSRGEGAEGADEEEEGWILSAAHLFNTGTDGFERYQGPLPLGLSFDQLNTDVVQMLGEPTSKGGHTIPIWLEYSQHGVQINFRGFAWDDRENPIASIVVYPAEVQELD